MAGSSRKEEEEKQEDMLRMVHEMKKNFKNNNNRYISNIKKSINMSIRSSSGSWSHQWWCFIAFTICCSLSNSVLGQMPSALLSATTASPQAVTTTTTITPTNITMAPPLTPRVIVESIAVNEQDVKKPINGIEAEILQLPHAFRHQQHYSHRIEQAVNDFRQQQLKQLQASHLKERDKPTDSRNTNNNNNNINNNKIKNNIKNDKNNNDDNNDGNDKRSEHSTKWQSNLNAPEQEAHHQRRHEHHWLLQQKQQEAKDRKKNHLHHNHHYAESLSSSSPFSSWDQHNNIPALRHQRHRNALITTTTLAPNIRDPITEADNELDKDNVEEKNNDDKGNRNLRLRVVNSMSLSLPTTNLNYSHGRQPPTRGPLILRNRVLSTRGPSKLRHQKQRAYVKNIMYSDEVDGPISGRRLSLKLHKDEGEEEEEENLSDKITRGFVNELDADDDDDDSFSYEDDEDDDNPSNEDNSNQYPTNKPPVKRFTNPFRHFFKSIHSSEAKLKTNTKNDNINNKSNKNNNHNEDENLFDDKLRSRVQQHHIRQQQHQHELEALRARHGGLGVGTNNMVNSGPNKHNTNNNNQASNNFVVVHLLIYCWFLLITLHYVVST